MTTFVTRETARDALVALFIATTKWESVYGYMPGAFDEESPVLTIRSGGTQQSMESFDVNPTEYQYVLKSFVLLDDKAGWTSPNAEDKIDELDQTFRQVIRENAGGILGGDWLKFQAGLSSTGFVIIDGETYRTEEWTVSAHFAKGS